MNLKALIDCVRCEIDECDRSGFEVVDVSFCVTAKVAREMVAEYERLMDTEFRMKGLEK